MCCNKEGLHSLHIKAAEEIQLGHVSGNYHFKSEQSDKRRPPRVEVSFKPTGRLINVWRRKFSDTCMTHKLHTYSLQRVLQLVVVSLVSMRRILRVMAKLALSAFPSFFLVNFSSLLAGV